MNILEKIDKLLVDVNQQVTPEIAASYSDQDLLTKFRRIPTDEILYDEITTRGLQDDPIVRALKLGGKAGDVSWDTRHVGDFENPEDNMGV
jgi:hypothetical protein